MKVAVVGAGTMGAFHAETLGAMEQVDGLLIVDADEGRAAEVARRTGGAAVSFEEAVEAADALIIVTPPEMHRAQVEAGLQAGRHVLCEKPLTDTLSSTIELTRRIEAEGAHVEIGFQRRHDPGFVAARDAVEGRLHVIRLTAHDPVGRPRGEPSGPVPEVAPTFRDSSIHDFDVTRWLSGQEVAEVFVAATNRDGSRPDDPRRIESAIVSMRLSGGTLAVLDASWLQPWGYDCRIELLSESSAISGGLSPRTPVRHADWTPELADDWKGYYLERFATAYRAELDAFLACCRGVRPPAATARDGLEAMRIAVAATRSHVEHRPVALDEIPGLSRREVA